MNRTRPTSPAPTDELDQRTLLLIRRVLCTHSPPITPLEELLPALTSSTEVDVQLYAFIAIIARDFILSWYGEISNDHAFIDEIVALIAHCTRSLEDRVRKIELEVLMLDEVPAILDAHVRDYRKAVERFNTALTPHLSLPEIFRGYQPHPALSNSTKSERLYMQFVSNGILALLLPTEDLESGCERSLLREILSSLVFGNILDKLSEPFMIYELIATVVGQLQPDVASPIKPGEQPSRRGSVRPGARLTSPPLPSNSPPPPDSPLPPHSTRFLSTLEYYFAGFTKVLGGVWSVLTSLHHVLVNPRPPRSDKRRPIIRTALLSCLSTLLNIPDLQPWLPTTLWLLSKPFESRATMLGAFLDDILLLRVSPRLSSSELVVTVLKIARSSLFPGDALGPPRNYPSGNEKARIRAATELVLLDMVPDRMKRTWWKDMDREGMAKEVGRNWLDSFGEKEINKVLIVRLIDLAISRVLPELLEDGGAKIKKQRTGLGSGHHDGLTSQDGSVYLSG